MLNKCLDASVKSNIDRDKNCPTFNGAKGLKNRLVLHFLVVEDFFLDVVGENWAEITCLKVVLKFLAQ